MSQIPIGWLINRGLCLPLITTGKWWSGWWFGCHFLNFPINIGFLSSSQLTKSYFSEGWVYNHQPGWYCCFPHQCFLSSHVYMSDMVRHVVHSAAQKKRWLDQDVNRWSSQTLVDTYPDAPCMDFLPTSSYIYSKNGPNVGNIPAPWSIWIDTGKGLQKTTQGVQKSGQQLVKIMIQWTTMGLLGFTLFSEPNRCEHGQPSKTAQGQPTNWAKIKHLSSGDWISSDTMGRFPQNEGPRRTSGQTS